MVAEYDIIKPGFPSPSPPPDPPPDYYPHLASVAISEQALLDTCVKEVEVTGISSIQDNTVKILYDGVEYENVPVWIHTDCGTRKKQLRGEEATEPVDYFERAATLWPMAGGVKIGPATDDYTRTPLGLCLIKIVGDPEEITPLGMVSVLQSVKKRRGYLDDHAIFPTWKPYVWIKIHTYRYNVNSSDVYIEPPEGAIYRESDGVGYFPLIEERIFIWDLEEESVAIIPNLAKDAFVTADTMAAADAATEEEIEKFLEHGITSTDAFPDDYLFVRPQMESAIAYREYPAGPITGYPEGTFPGIEYVGYDGLYAIPGYTGTSTGSSVSLTSAWSEVTASIEYNWGSLPSSSFEACYLWGSTIRAYTWHVQSTANHWFKDNSVYTSSSLPQFSELYLGRYRVTFTFDGDEYIFHRCIKDYKFNSTITKLPTFFVRDYERHDSTEFSVEMVCDIKRDGNQVTLDTFSVSTSFTSSFTNVDLDNISEYEEGYMSLISQKSPISVFFDSFLTGKTGFFSIFTALSTVLLDGDRATESYSFSNTPVEYINYSLPLGNGNGYITALTDYIQSMYSSFESEPKNNESCLLGGNTHPDSNNSYAALFTPDSMCIKDVIFYIVPYDIEDALIEI